MNKQLEFLSQEISREEEEARQLRAAEAIRTKYRAIQVTTSQMPYQHKVPTHVKQKAIKQFGASDRAVGMHKRLFNAKEEAVKRVRAVVADIRRTLDDPKYILPYPEPGVRLVLEDKIEALDARLEQLRGELAVAAEALYRELPAIRERQREELAELFEASDYEFDPRQVFSLSWHYKSVDIPDYLSKLNPKIVEREREAVRQEFLKAVKIKEDELAQNLLAAVDHLVERLTDTGEDGKRKVFQKSTVEAVFDAVDEAERQFAENQIGGERINTAVTKLKAYLQGQSADTLGEKLRDGEHFGRALAEKLAKVSETIADLRVAPKRRSVIYNKK